MKFAALILMVVTGLVAHFSRFQLQGHDLGIYREMAQMGIAGNDPFTHPYADFPPLKMAALMLVEQLNLWTTWLVAMDLAVMVLLIWAAYLFYPSSGAPLLAGILYLAPMVFWRNWIFYFEDKMMYVIGALLIFILLAPRSSDKTLTPGRLILASLIAGLLAAYGGIGIYAIPLLLMAALRTNPSDRLQAVLAVLGTFSAIVIGSHLFFFPDWIAAYMRRADRMAATPCHMSIFRLLSSIELYSRWMPTAASIIVALLAYWKYVAGSSLLSSLGLTYFGSLAFGPEASYDRILAALLPICLLLLDSNTGRAAFALVIVLLSAVGHLVTDEPESLRLLAFSWVPILFVPTYLVGRDLLCNVRASARLLPLAIRGWSRIPN